MKEARIEVYGRVQGVRFRNSVKKFAENLKIKGFAMNKEDGSIYILAQGEEKNLCDLIFFIQKSPGFSKIESLNYKMSNAEKEYPDFRVVREGNFILDKAKSLLRLGRFVTGYGQGRIPVHVAIIPDGNRRWAKNKGLEGTFGHYKAGSYDNMEELFIEGKNLGVKYMSLWGFSTENWKRSEKEKNEIFDLILIRARRFLKDAEKNKIRFRHIGRKDRLPKELVKVLLELEKATEKYTDFNVQLCLDYGGRDEIVRAVNKMLKSGKKNVDEKIFEDYLDTKGIPDPDLIIRTSGERRLSGLFPYQGTYAEMYFSDMHFPDFNGKELRKAILEFGKRNRRFGGN